MLDTLLAKPAASGWSRLYTRQELGGASRIDAYPEESATAAGSIVP
jgi:hypothetical protein